MNIFEVLKIAESDAADEIRRVFDEIFARNPELKGYYGYSKIKVSMRKHTGKSYANHGTFEVARNYEQGGKK